ncbi:unnamed protein product, partial [Protopolystoma xenopodis]
GCSAAVATGVGPKVELVVGRQEACLELDATDGSDGHSTVAYAGSPTPCCYLDGRLSNMSGFVVPQIFISPGPTVKPGVGVGAGEEATVAGCAYSPTSTVSLVEFTCQRRTSDAGYSTQEGLAVENTLSEGEEVLGVADKIHLLTASAVDLLGSPSDSELDSGVGVGVGKRRASSASTADVETSDVPTRLMVTMANVATGVSAAGLRGGRPTAGATVAASTGTSFLYPPTSLSMRMSHSASDQSHQPTHRLVLPMDALQVISSTAMTVPSSHELTVSRRSEGCGWAEKDRPSVSLCLAGRQTAPRVARRPPDGMTTSCQSNANLSSEAGRPRFGCAFLSYAHCSLLTSPGHNFCPDSNRKHRALANGTSSTEEWGYSAHCSFFQGL